MKFMNYTLLIVACFVTSIFYGQNIKGIATYKSQRQLDIQLDSTQVNDEMREQMMAMMKKQFEKEHTLTFTADESVYKEVEKLDSGAPMGGNFQVVVVGMGGSDVLYKNLKEHRFANQNEMFSKQFLIKDEIENLDWELGKETKNIGEYTCFKATAKRTITRIVSSSVSTNDEEASKKEETEEEQIITAWYTPQIPIKNGPRNYGGLPGLILEVNDGSETILCSRVVLNPNEGVNIKEPKKGKEVTSEEYEKIMTKKSKEMQERYHGNDKRKGDSFSINIKG